MCIFSCCKCKCDKNGPDWAIAKKIRDCLLVVGKAELFELCINTKEQGANLIPLLADMIRSGEIASCESNLGSKVFYLTGTCND